MKVRLISRRLLPVILFAMVTPVLQAQDGFKGAVSRANFSTSFSKSLAVADFDNDQKPDGAVLVNSGGIGAQHNFRVELHLTSHENTEFSFESNQTALEVFALDIDQDGDADVVIEQAFTHKRLHVWINDGGGTFHEEQAQDFPAAEIGTRQSLDLPSNEPGDGALAFPSRRVFEIAGLSTLPLLSRPPTDSKFQRQSARLTPASPLLVAHSSRAPPRA